MAACADEFVSAPLARRVLFRAREVTQRCVSLFDEHEQMGQLLGGDWTITGAPAGGAQVRWSAPR
jgi:hypothetical protein